MSVLLRGVKRLNVSWFIGTKEPWENGRGGASYVESFICRTMVTQEQLTRPGLDNVNPWPKAWFKSSLYIDFSNRMTFPSLGFGTRALHYNNT